MFSLRVSAHRTGRPTSRARPAPPPGPADLAGEPRDEDVLDRRAALRAEATADVGHTHADLRRVDAERAGQRVARRVRRLRRRPVLEASVLAPRRDRDAALHGARREPLAAE